MLAIPSDSNGVSDLNGVAALKVKGLIFSWNPSQGKLFSYFEMAWASTVNHIYKSTPAARESRRGLILRLSTASQSKLWQEFDL